MENILQERQNGINAYNNSVNKCKAYFENLDNTDSSLKRALESFHSLIEQVIINYIYNT